MKFNKKMMFICMIPFAIIIAVIIICSVLLMPKEKRKEFPWIKTKEDYNIRSYALCNEKNCSKEEKPLSEASYKKSCSTEECVLTAAEIIRWMDKRVKPCDDFYNFSCGAFSKYYTLPEGDNLYSTNGVYKDRIDLKVKGIVERPFQGNDGQSLRNTKDAYRSCIDLTQIEDTSVDNLRAILSVTGIGEWPFLQPDWKECRTDLEWRMAKLNSLGIPSLVQLETRFLKRAEYRLQAVMRMASPLVEYSSEEGNVSLALEKAEEHMELLHSVLELMDVNITEDVEKDIKDVFRFDFYFCNATRNCRQSEMKIVEREEDRYTLLQLADAAPQINWIRWRNIIFSELRLNFPHDRQKIYVHGIESCIEDVDDLLRNTSSRVLANYLTWKFVFYHLGFLGSQFRQLLKQHKGLTKSSSEHIAMLPTGGVPRWKQCVAYIKRYLPMSLLREYHNMVAQKEVRKVMNDIVSRVKNEFRTIMKDTRSLLENDRIKSYHKIDQIQVNVNYPTRDVKFYDTFYADLGPMGGSFLKNGMKIRALYTRRMLYGVFTFKSMYDTEYAILGGSDPFDVHAESDFNRNTIIFTLGMLQSYGLTVTLPKYKSLSTFGWILGHEISHGFDLQTLEEVFQTNWTTWPSYVLKQVQRKAQCFAKSTGDATLFQMLRENPTLNEDVCDSQGIHLAFKAYLNYLHSHGDEDNLPGLPYSNEELFFINYAQQFCEIRSGKEAPSGRRRVNNVLRNFPDFVEAFRCPSNSPMNAHRCDPLWT